MVRKKRSARKSRPFTRSSTSRTGLSAYAFGNALGIVSAVALLFYAMMSWFSNYDGTIIVAQYPLYFSLTNWTLIIGLVQTYVMSYIGGWIFAKTYNKSRR